MSYSVCQLLHAHWKTWNKTAYFDRCLPNVCRMCWPRQEMEEWKRRDQNRGKMKLLKSAGWFLGVWIGMWDRKKKRSEGWRVEQMEEEDDDGKRRWSKQMQDEMGTMHVVLGSCLQWWLVVMYSGLIVIRRTLGGIPQVEEVKLKFEQCSYFAYFSSFQRA